MVTGPTCGLCGGSFTWHRSREDALGAERQWTSDVRGLRGVPSSSRLDGPSLTGPGYTDRGKLVASLDSDATDLVEATAQNEHRVSIPHMTDTHRVYVMHEFCWRLLLDRLGAKVVTASGGPKRIASWLFHILAALPSSKDGGLAVQNGYLGAVHGRFSFSESHVDEVEIFMDDPTQSLTEVNPTAHRDIQTTESLFHSDWPSTGNDPFNQLSAELLQLIFQQTRSRDLGAARLASRTLAVHASPSRLPRAFWKSRFADGMEMGFVGSDAQEAAAQDPHLDYHRTYLVYGKVLRREKYWPAAKNRRRIWRCLDHLLPTLYTCIRLQENDLSSKLDASEAAELPESCVLGDRVSCPGMSGTWDLVRGARALLAQTLFFGGRDAVSAQEDVLLTYSTILFDGETFLSQCHTQENVQGLEPDAAYQPPMNERGSGTGFVKLERGDSVRDIDLYMSAEGIQGIVLHVEASHGAMSSRPMGIVSCLGQTFVNRLSSYGTISGFLFHFDMFKLVSLQTIYSSVDPDLISRQATPSRESRHLLEILPRSYEMPQIPNLFRPELSIPFGGKAGSRLCLLTSVTALMDGATGLFGLRFQYGHWTDGELYGSATTWRYLGIRDPCIEQTFLINGPGGERITSFAYSRKESRHHTGYNAIVSLEITTNFDRCCTFRGMDMHRFKGETCFSTPSRSDRYPTELRVSLGGPVSFFQTLEVVCTIPVPGDTIIDVRETRDAHMSERARQAIPWMLNGSGRGSCLTSASLADVCRVRLSVGADGRSRLRSHFSGLWFEYRDGIAYDTIVGQWMEELDSFTLQPGEALVEIRVRLTEEISIPVPAGQRQQLGKVNNLLFITSLGYRYEYQLSGPSPPHRSRGAEARYMATPYEDLSVLTWSFYRDVDDVHVSLRANNAMDNGSLLLCDAGAMAYYHPCLLQESSRVFFRYQDPKSPWRIMLDRSIHTYDAMRRYTCAYRTFFWEEKDPIDPRQTVHVRRIEMMRRDGVLSGLRFEYDGGLVLSYGQGDETIVVDLDRSVDERLSSMTIYYATYAGYVIETRPDANGLEIRTTIGNVYRVFPDDREVTSVSSDSYALLRDAPAPLSDDEENDEQEVMDEQLVDMEDEMMEGIQQDYDVGGDTDRESEAEVYRRHHSFPDENPTGRPVTKSVGIWVCGSINLERKTVDSLGPIYMTEPERRPADMDTSDYSV